jgi:hypothetical protein
MYTCLVRSLNWTLGDRRSFVPLLAGVLNVEEHEEVEVVGAEVVEVDVGVVEFSHFRYLDVVAGRCSRW